MNIEKNIDKIIEDLLISNSEIDYLKELKNRSLEIVKKDIDLDEALASIAKDIKEETDMFLNQKNTYDTNFITGISSCIYLPDYENNGEYKLKLFGGSASRIKSIKVSENTLFDIASITKLYTLILLFKLEELEMIDLNIKIKDINPDFQNLEDFTLNDLVRMHGELRTQGNIITADSEEEVYEILKTLYLSSNNREENKYTDFGAMVISDTIEKVISNKLGEKMTFDEIMAKYLLHPLSLYSTQYNPSQYDLGGNGNNKRKPHDPKARILGGAFGHAGLFVTSEDLARLSKSIYKINYFNKRGKAGILKKIHVDRLGEVTFPNSNQSNKGNLGIYLKHSLGYEKSFTPPEFSKGSFSHQGWTGSLATFDPNNFIHQNILVNSIYSDEDENKVKNDKPVGFGSAFEEYQKQITRNTMLMYIAKKYYNKYCNIKENIEVTKYI